jgi:ABC-type oligopeptide transport system ATPase subunit
MPKHIDVKELNKIFEVHDTKVHALKNVSFNVDKGEVLSVLGASGSGGKVRFCV